MKNKKLWFRRVVIFTVGFFIAGCVQERISDLSEENFFIEPESSELKNDLDSNGNGNEIFFQEKGVLGKEIGYTSNLYLPIIEIPETLMFCGREYYLPVGDKGSYDVRYNLRREIVTMSVYSISWILRSGRYLPYIDQVLAEAGLPSDFRYLPAPESYYNPDAASDYALGLWQHYAGTARIKFKKIDGLTVSPTKKGVDQRRDFWMQTHQSARYLDYLINRHDDPMLALAEWNYSKTGRTIVDQGIESFLEGFFASTEASRFPYKNVASKLIYENWSELILEKFEKDRLLPLAHYKMIIFTKGCYLNDLKRACGIGIKYSDIRILNPQFVSAIYNKKDKDNKIPYGNWTIRVPADTTILANFKTNFTKSNKGSIKKDSIEGPFLF
jgi:hypothetical protein